MIKRINFVVRVITASIFIANILFVSIRAETEIQTSTVVTQSNQTTEKKIVNKKPKKVMLLPNDPTIRLNRPIHNPTYDKNLRVSLENNYMKEVERWYNEGANINSIDPQGRSLLYNAINRNRIHHIKYLLLRRANVNVQNADGTKPLEAAVFRGNLMVARYLLERNASPRGFMRHQKITYLQYALDRGDQPMVLQLIDSGANINAVYPDGSSLLHRAAAKGLHDIVAKLLSKGAKVDSVYNGGITPLHEAAAKGKTYIIQQLLIAQADIEAQTQKQWTALHHAARFGHQRSVRYLLQRGASPFIRNSDGKTPASLAWQLDHTIVYDILAARGAVAEEERQANKIQKKRQARYVANYNAQRIQKSQPVQKAQVNRAVVATPVVATKVSVPAQPRVKRCFLFFCR